MQFEVANDRLLTIDQARGRLQLSKRTFMRLIELRVLEMVDVGTSTIARWRVAESELTRFIESRTRKRDGQEKNIKSP